MRLIDGDALKQKITMVTTQYKPNAIMERPAILLEDVDEAPTIDAVEVVRCKDCRWFNDRLKRDGAEDNRYAPSICTLHGRPHSNTYFCADGEVKE